MGLLERDQENIKLSDAGRQYVEAATVEAKAAVMQDQLRTVALYNQTLDWLHYNKRTSPTKTDIANYWHDKHPAETGGASGDALTDAVVFFMRMVNLSGLAEFVPAGRSRDSHLKVKSEALEAYVANREGAGSPRTREKRDEVPEGGSGRRGRSGGRPIVTLGTGINVNIQIHIAADTPFGTIEEIFRNMRKYLLTPDEQQEA